MEGGRKVNDKTYTCHKPTLIGNWQTGWIGDFSAGHSVNISLQADMKKKSFDINTAQSLKHIPSRIDLNAKYIYSINKMISLRHHWLCRNLMCNTVGGVMESEHWPQCFSVPQNSGVLLNSILPRHHI